MGNGSMPTAYGRILVPFDGSDGASKALRRAVYLAEALGPRGMRVNGVSAGPIKTLAASGIADFGKMLKFNEASTPLRRNVTIEQVGDASAFLLSDLAGGVTAEILHVDAGMHAVVGGMAALGAD